MKKILIVGLGNPGVEYEGTRHNLGVRALRAWVSTASDNAAMWKEDAGLHAEVAEVVTGDANIICLFPLTFMNNSGSAVAAYLKNNEPERILVVHDELELSPGEMRLKDTGSAVGHRGVKSIHDALGTQDVMRLRIGIGRPVQDLDVKAYVLQKFTVQEEKVIQETIIPAASRMIHDWVKEVA